MLIWRTMSSRFSHSPTANDIYRMPAQIMLSEKPGSWGPSLTYTVRTKHVQNQILFLMLPHTLHRGLSHQFTSKVASVDRRIRRKCFRYTSIAHFSIIHIRAFMLHTDTPCTHPLLTTVPPYKRHVEPSVSAFSSRLTLEETERSLHSWARPG